MNDYHKKLNQYRNDIDEIDNKILSLIKERVKIVAKVKEIKEQNNEKFFIKSAREADMISEIIKKAGDDIPNWLIIDVWRKFITASNLLEQPELQIVLHNPKKSDEFIGLVREYYCQNIPLIVHDNANNVIIEVEKNNAKIAIFALPNQNQNSLEAREEDWWIGLSNHKLSLKVFAKIPFVKNKNDVNLVAMAVKELEKSQKDCTLFCIEVDDNISKSQLLDEMNNCNMKAQILKSVQLKQVTGFTFHLVEADGFFIEEGDEFKKFKTSKIKPFIKLLGVYPIL